MLKILALGAAALSLTACASASPVEVLEVLGKAYGHCERTVTYSASVGPLNPASGGQINGTVKCPPAAPAP